NKYTFVKQSPAGQEDKTLGPQLGQLEKAVWEGTENGGKGIDYAVIRPTNPAYKPTPAVTDHKGGKITIDGLAVPVEGMPACHSGDTTGVTCGTVVNAREQAGVVDHE